jgi:hypothetical protein
MRALGAADVDSTTCKKQSMLILHFLAFLPEDGLNLLNLNRLKLTNSSEAAFCGVIKFCSEPFEEQLYPGRNVG